jgi:hypothetical protein
MNTLALLIMAIVQGTILVITITLYVKVIRKGRKKHQED